MKWMIASLALMFGTVWYCLVWREWRRRIREQEEMKRHVRRQP